MTTPLPSPPRRWPWLRLAVLVLLALVVTSFWKMALRYQAASELRAAGFWPGREDVWQVAREDWHQLFKWQTWQAQRGAGTIDTTKAWHIRNLDALGRAFRRLDLEFIRIQYFPELQNVDGLKDVRTLKDLTINNCGSLENLHGLKYLPSLKNLTLNGCYALTNVNDLQGLTILEHLDLSDCTALRNVDGLQGFTALQSLILNNCFALENVDALRGLTSLEDIQLDDTDQLSAESVAALRAALPNATISRSLHRTHQPLAPSPEGH